MNLHQRLVTNYATTFALVIQKAAAMPHQSQISHAIENHSYAELRSVLEDLPMTWYTDLIIAMVKASYKKRVWMEHGCSVLVASIESNQDIAGLFACKSGYSESYDDSFDDFSQQTHCNEPCD